MKKSYDKLIELISSAKGDRSINQFAMNCKINAGHLSRILNGKFKNPPTPELLKKISNKAYNGITYNSLMEAAGHISNNMSDDTVSESSAVYDNYDEITEILDELRNREDLRILFKRAKNLKPSTVEAIVKMVEKLKEDNEGK